MPPPIAIHFWLEIPTLRQPVLLTSFLSSISRPSSTIMTLDPLSRCHHIYCYQLDKWDGANQLLISASLKGWIFSFRHPSYHYLTCLWFPCLVSRRNSWRALSRRLRSVDHHEMWIEKREKLKKLLYLLRRDFKTNFIWFNLQHFDDVDVFPHLLDPINGYLWK